MTNTNTKIEPEAEAAIETPRSVVRPEYKARYAERERAMVRRPKGIARKVLARGSGDWLTLEMAKLTNDPKSGKVDVPTLEAILDANGIDHSHWNRTTRGWQGRLKMTGTLALRKPVAEDGELVLPDGSTITAPKVWIAKHLH